jgi:DNA topoisomerase-1
MKPTTLSAPEELVREARAAGLRYTSDDRPGITRRRHGKEFTYHRPNGSQIRDKPTLGRIKRLAIPPAWENVWISALDNGHVQATGRDARKRKQYRYHPYWRQQRDETKFGHTLAFARVLPKIRRRVAADLRRKDMGKEKILATVVRLLETTVIRVGNDEYARENKSYGLTTMRNRHVEVKKADISFSFRGKSGKHHDITLHDPRLAKIIRACQDLPGQELFTYTENGKAAGHIGVSRRERLPARNHRQRFHGEGFPHVDRHRPRRHRLPGIRSGDVENTGEEKHRHGDRKRVENPRQHARRLPQMLRASGGDHCLYGW